MLEDQLFSLAYCAMAVVAVFGVGVVFYLNSRGSKKNMTLLEDLILNERQQNRDGYTSVIDKSRFIGAIGICLTDLRPAGTISVDGEPLDVVTEGGFVKVGTSVKVINVDGSRILVRAIVT